MPKTTDTLRCRDPQDHAIAIILIVTSLLVPEPPLCLGPLLLLVPPPPCFQAVNGRPEVVGAEVGVTPFREASPMIS